MRSWELKGRCFNQSLIKRLSIGIVFIEVVVANNSLT